MNSDRSRAGHPKETELHCHTKMSRKHGLIEPEALIRFAIKNEYEAIAVTDYGSLQAFPAVYRHLQRISRKHEEDNTGFTHKLPKIIYGIDGHLVRDNGERERVLIYAKNQSGLHNLYRLFSESERPDSAEEPVFTEELINRYRDGLLVGSAFCDDNPENRIEDTPKALGFYDFLEVSPRDKCEDNARWRILNGPKCGKMVVPMSDAHYLYKDEDYVFGILHGNPEYYKNERHIRTVEEQIDYYSKLLEGHCEDVEKAVAEILENGQRLADMTEEVVPIIEERHYPAVEDAWEDIIDICDTRIRELYGKDIPHVATDRLIKELNGLARSGFESIYMLKRLLVKKSGEDGYPVGSRGGVAASFIAYLLEITDMNPLPAHYVCKNCNRAFFDLETSEPVCTGMAGADLPDRDCPACGKKLSKDGFDLPVETFLGYHLEREPDIDLNFAVSEADSIKEYLATLPCIGGICHAGTIGTMQESDADILISGFEGDLSHTLDAGHEEYEKALSLLSGVKKTSGKHPGGMLVVPAGEDITRFTPIWKREEDRFPVSHFDYWTMDGALLKIDVLSHTMPEMLHCLQQETGVDPHDIPLDDKKVFSLFHSTEALNIKPEDIGGETTGLIGIPEFGSDITKDIIKKLEPGTVTDLIKILSITHGTGTWEKNTDSLISNGEATIADVIGSRDDVFQYLLSMGMDGQDAYEIMEHVRKGKGLTNEMKEKMWGAGVPTWYTDSCKKIRYLFPKAHSANYTVMNLWIAYFKVYHPEAFYKAYQAVMAGEPGGEEKDKLVETERLARKQKQTA